MERWAGAAANVEDEDEDDEEEGGFGVEDGAIFGTVLGERGLVTE